MQDPTFRSLVFQALKERNLLNSQEEPEDGERPEKTPSSTPEFDSKNSTNKTAELAKEEKLDMNQEMELDLGQTGALYVPSHLSDR